MCIRAYASMQKSYSYYSSLTEVRGILLATYWSRLTRCLLFLDYVLQASWSASSLTFSCLCVPSCCRNAGNTDVRRPIWLSTWVLELELWSSPLLETGVLWGTSFKKCLIFFFFSAKFPWLNFSMKVPAWSLNSSEWRQARSGASDACVGHFLVTRIVNTVTECPTARFYLSQQFYEYLFLACPPPFLFSPARSPLCFHKKHTQKWSWVDETSSEGWTTKTMLLERSRFHASSCLTAGCSVTNSSKTAALSFQTEYNWKQKILLGAVLPGLLGIGGSLLSLICACAYVCTLALTLTQEQTCLSEVAANPGRGSENSSPSWERSLGGMLQKKTQSDFPWCGWRDKHLPSSGSEFGEMSRREKNLSSPSIFQMFMPFRFFQSLWQHSEGRWAPWVTMGNENSTSDHQVGQEASLPPAAQLSWLYLPPPPTSVSRGKSRHSLLLDPCGVFVPVGPLRHYIFGIPLVLQPVSFYKSWTLLFIPCF